MIIPTKDVTRISFGKLSNPLVMASTPLARDNPNLQYFTDDHFQFLVDNIADMFGMPHGTVHTAVEEQDYELGWIDQNQNQIREKDEILFRFTMNASMSPYSRESLYGKHFMYTHAQEYGTPFIFGVIAHEVGHLVNHYAMNALENRLVNGISCLVEVQRLAARWDELCADYLSGVVLAQAQPRLSHEPIKNFFRGTTADEAHPDGIWRMYAVEMGYQWGASKSPMLASRILCDRDQTRQLLTSFVQGYYQQVYCAVDESVRQRYSDLPQYMLENCFDVIARL